MEPVEALRAHRRVVFPPDLVLDPRSANDVLVLGRPAGELAGGDQQCATIAELSLAPGEGRLDQRRFGQVVIDRSQPGDTLILEMSLRIDPARVHETHPPRLPPRLKTPHPPRLTCQIGVREPVLR